VKGTGQDRLQHRTPAIVDGAIAAHEKAFREMAADGVFKGM